MSLVQRIDQNAKLPFLGQNRPILAFDFGRVHRAKLLRRLAAGAGIGGDPECSQPAKNSVYINVGVDEGNQEWHTTIVDIIEIHVLNPRPFPSEPCYGIPRTPCTTNLLVHYRVDADVVVLCEKRKQGCRATMRAVADMQH